MHVFIYFRTVFALKRFCGAQEKHVFAGILCRNNFQSLQSVHRAVEEVSQCAEVP